MIYVQIVQCGATKRETVQPQHNVEHGVMGTGLIIILIIAMERISLDVRIVVVAIKYTTVAAGESCSCPETRTPSG
jgi:hypothetical protein